ncbi:DUF3099 domain-containing protein [soil metagenome]
MHDSRVLPDLLGDALMQRARRQRLYFTLMGACVLLFVLAWPIFRYVSTAAGVAMCVVAAVLPPTAAVVGNLGSLDASAPPTGDAGDDLTR